MRFFEFEKCQKYFHFRIPNRFHGQGRGNWSRPSSSEPCRPSLTLPHVRCGGVAVWRDIDGLVKAFSQNVVIAHGGSWASQLVEATLTSASCHRVKISVAISCFNTICQYMITFNTCHTYQHINPYINPYINIYLYNYIYKCNIYRNLLNPYAFCGFVRHPY